MANVSAGFNIPYEWQTRNGPGGFALDPSTMSRDEVREYQRELNKYGAGLKVDGVWGPRTASAYNTVGSGGQYTGSTMSLPDDLQSTLNSLSSSYSAPQVTYNIPSDEDLTEQLSAALRPSYDQAIKNRQTQTTKNRAEIDADAAARGLGASTWVTDVKDRQEQYQEDDVATLETQYGSALSSALSDLKNAHQSNKLQADMANASMQQEAMQQALSAAISLYQLADSRKTSGGGSGGGGGAGVASSDPTKRYLELLENKDSITSGLPATSDRSTYLNKTRKNGISGYTK